MLGVCGRSVAWLTRLPVTEKITGSNPAARALLRQGFVVLAHDVSLANEVSYEALAK